jgi:L-cystine transport system permease protein
LGTLFDPQFFLSVFPELAKALPVTLKIAAVAMALALLIGLAVALARIYRVPVLSQLAAVYVSFARGTPLLVQIYLAYYGIPVLLGWLKERHGVSIDLSEVQAIVYIYFAFSFNVGAYLSETIRAATWPSTRARWRRPCRWA